MTTAREIDIYEFGNKTARSRRLGATKLKGPQVAVSELSAKGHWNANGHACLPSKCECSSNGKEPNKINKCVYDISSWRQSYGFCQCW